MLASMCDLEIGTNPAEAGVAVIAEMLRAGLIELYEFNRLEDNGEDVLVGIFRSMYELMPTYPCRSCPRRPNEARDGNM